MANEQYWYASGGSGLGGWTKASESFITGDAYTLVSVYLPLQQGLYTTGNAHIYLYAVDGSHYPTGEPLLTIGTITAEELTGSVQWKLFSGLSYSMLATTEYAIVIEIDEYDETYGDQENIPQIRWLSKSGYAGQPSHQYWYDDAGTWRHTATYSVVAAADFGFITVSGVALPTKATSPSPANDSTKQDFSGLVLDWTDGGGADTFDVWMGPTGALVKVADAIVPSTFTVDIEDVPTDQVIYWRVDSTNDTGTTEGDVWNFDARPGQIATTTPADEETGVTLHGTTGSWESPSDNTTSYDVYYGTLSGFLDLVENTEDLESILYEYNFPLYGEIYYWRVDAVNAFGTTQGGELSFTTLVFAPPSPATGGTGGGGGEGEESSPTGENNMITLKRLVAAAANKFWYENI